MDVIESHGGTTPAPPQVQESTSFERWLNPWKEMMPIIVVFIGWAFYTGVRVTSDEDKLGNLATSIQEIKTDIGLIRTKLEKDVKDINEEVFKIKLEAAMRNKTP